MGKLLHLESMEQRAVIEWAKWQKVPEGPLIGYLFAIPNGGARSSREAKILKAEGVQRSVSDLFLSYPSGPFAGLYLEMKKCRRDFRTPGEADKAASAGQVNFLCRMIAVGFAGCIAYGSEQATEAITAYLEEREWAYHEMIFAMHRIYADRENRSPRSPSA